MNIRKMSASDWPAVAKIYTEGIATGFATFETSTPSYEAWNTAHMSTCRIVATENDMVLGWAALSPVSNRCVYGGIAEVSVYVGSNSRGKGAGKALLETLITESEKEGLWTIQAGIFLENEASIALHKKVGFRYIGKREKVGKLKGVWKDNLLFERRSVTVGI
jgi:phosphinothricin acetyltransferase